MGKHEPNSSSQDVDEIIEQLIGRRLPKSERIKLIKELVEKGEDLPDEILDEALKRLMERLLD